MNYSKGNKTQNLAVSSFIPGSFLFIIYHAAIYQFLRFFSSVYRPWIFIYERNRDLRCPLISIFLKTSHFICNAACLIHVPWTELTGCFILIDLVNLSWIAVLPSGLKYLCCSLRFRLHLSKLSLCFLAGFGLASPCLFQQSDSQSFVCYSSVIS